MIEIGENYYLISKDEITDDMEPLANGLYKLGENLYEVIGDKDSSTTSQNSDKKQMGTTRTNNYLTVFFVFSVLLLAFTVLCAYVGISNIVEYEKAINQGNQLGAVGEMVIENISSLLRNGVLWLLGGVASLILGCILSLIYNSQK